MKLKIAEKVHVNSHVSKLGWKYPILIWPKLDFLDATQRLLPTFGDSAKRYHFKSWSSQTTPIIKGTWVNIAHWNVDSIPATVCGMPVVDLQGVTFGWYLKPKKIVH
jgi:hypothetical protein